MQVVIIANHFPPQNTSAAVQLSHLAKEFASRKIKTLVIAPTRIRTKTYAENYNNLKIIRIPKITVQKNYFLRTLSEIIDPLIIFSYFLRKPLRDEEVNILVWYSPTIFNGILVFLLKIFKKFHAYLILRDIFPEWAVDLGLMKKFVTYYFFKFFANLQYFTADTIGVQTESNLKYVYKWAKKSRKIEVLENWQSEQLNPKPCSLKINKTNLKGRKIFCYIGNMGIAQSMDFLINLAYEMKGRDDIGFLFVGRGSEWDRLLNTSLKLELNNTLVYPELPSEEITDLLRQCNFGLIALDPRHMSHNIPGKFLTYLLAGLPILARINPGTDLEKIIVKNKLGFCYSGEEILEFKNLANQLTNLSEKELTGIEKRSKKLALTKYSPSNAVNKILSSLRNNVKV
tara:strand:- start:5308 stop:6507 length:1200 start_codon:yes stop_codon:yes gene_type:complete